MWQWAGTWFYCVCAGYDITFAMVIILDRIMGDEVDADLGKDLVEAIASV
jgi:hypothetical protein